ncbi:hypothetical protein V6Z12_A07G121800 [Gossypium hirsutum]
MDDALEAMVMALKEEIAELKGGLTIYKVTLGSGMLALEPKQRNMDVSKPKEFKGTRSAKDVDNFLWRIEQYFRAIGIGDDATKVKNASIYFTDVAFLWWHHRSTDKKRVKTLIIISCPSPNPRKMVGETKTRRKRMVRPKMLSETSHERRKGR